MLKKVTVVLFALGIVGQVSAQRSDFFSAKDRDLLARFDGGVGVIPTSGPVAPVNEDGSFQNVNRNVVRGVPPPGQPWRIAELRANIDGVGRVKVRGRGLLLAGGNSLGTNANLSVFATLICEAAAPFVQRSTALAGVPLEANGDFRIDATLDSVPAECASPVLLIRAAGGGTWLAAGILAFGDN